MATRGSLLVPGVLVSYLAPASGIFTTVSYDQDAPPLMGQIVHTPGASIARMSFVAPKDNLPTELMPGLFEHLSKQAGEHGAHNIIIEVDEQDTLYESFRKTGLTIYTRQRVWLLDGHKNRGKSQYWRPAQTDDRIPIKSLHINLVPGMVQQIEPLGKDIYQGLVCWNDGDLVGYVTIEYGPRGLWVQPFIHPDVVEIDELLIDMIASIPDRRSRPVYICVRNYQSWLEASLDRLGGMPGEQQAVMVKRMAITQKVVQRFSMQQIEGSPDASIAHMEMYADGDGEVIAHNSPT